MIDANEELDVIGAARPFQLLSQERSRETNLVRMASRDDEGTYNQQMDCLMGGYHAADTSRIPSDLDKGSVHGDRHFGIGARLSVQGIVDLEVSSRATSMISLSL